MATINYDSTLVLTSPSVFTVSTSYRQTIEGFVQDNNVLTNIRTSDLFDFTGTYPSFPNIGIVGVKSQTLATPNGDFGSGNFPDGVYSCLLTQGGEDTGDLYTSTSYALVTTQIDAAIAAYPQATFFDRANLAAIQYLREQIDVAYADEDYTLTNLIIGNCLTYIGYTISNVNLAVATLSKTNNSTLFFNALTNPSSATPTISQYNEILNTRTNSFRVFENQSLIPTGIGSMNIDSTNTYLTPIYSDAVYQTKSFYISPTYLNLDDSTAAQQTGYVLITTTIDLGWELFQEYYDPTNASQLAAYNAILAAYATIDSLDGNLPTNFAAINAQIVIIENLLALFINLESTLTLPSINTLLITLPNVLPNLTYSNQTGTVTNTSTGAVFSFSGFPQSYVDLTFEVSSEDLNMGEQIEDAVYQSNVDFENSLDQLFNAQAYCLVTTFIDCGIAGLIAKRPNCKPIFSQLNTLMTYKSMIVAAFNNQDYNNCNILIKKCIGILKKDGCNCGCS
jgi:hypothetical protein